MVLQVEKLTGRNRYVRVWDYSSSESPEGKVLSENTKLKMIKFSKTQPRPSPHNLTKLCPVGDEEPLEGFEDSTLAHLQLAKSVMVPTMRTKVTQNKTKQNSVGRKSFRREEDQFKFFKLHVPEYSCQNSEE